MNTQLTNAWAEAEKNPGRVIDIGDIVVCDFCSDDHTHTSVDGGLIFGSYAVCPKCVSKVTGEASHIKAVCPVGTTFADFVRQYRGSNNKIVMHAQPKPGCRSCKQPFTDANVHTSAGWAEVSISGMCETCFDAMFEGIEE